MERIQQVVRNIKGFTVLELMVVAFILTLATSIVALGMPSAVRAYEEITSGAEAQVLLATATTLLRENLDNASYVEPCTDAKVLDYTDGDSSLNSSITSDNEAGITVTRGGNTNFLLSDAVTKKKLHVSFETVSFGTSVENSDETSVITFENVRIYKNNKDQPLISLEEFKVRPFESYKVRPFES